MEDPLQYILREFIPLRDQEGHSKIMSLPEALSKFVEPGLTLHIGVAPIPPYRTMFELTRLFKDRNPGFTLVSMGLTTGHSLLVHTGMVRRAITTFLGDSYPSPGPNPVFQNAFREGRLEVEHWSLLALVLRLKAAAMGLPFFPTRSILGSSMETDNRDSFMSSAVSFDGQGRTGLLRALAPDLSFYHGVAADAQGNTLFAPPFAENLYGALASKRGVVVTVEKIVPTTFIRDHAGFVRLPGNRVLSVSEVPMGGHPGGCNAHEIPEIHGYAADNQFIHQWRQSCKSPEALEDWMREWVLDCPTQAAYMEKIGSERVRTLKEKSRPDSWQGDVQSAAVKIQAHEPANAMERMVAAAARFIINRVKQKKYRSLLAGIGAANLAAWLATYHLRQEQYDIDVMAEVGFFGYLPRPTDPFIFNFKNIPTCKMLTDITEILGMHVGGSHCLGALSAAQIDRFGNINSTLVPPDFLITGSGGSNDVASSADEVLLVVPQSLMRFVHQVPYITAPGLRMNTLISTLGLYEKRDPQGEFVLTGIIQDGQSSTEAMVGLITSQCGWKLKIADDLQMIKPPEPEELTLLRLFDPDKFFISG